MTLYYTLYITCTAAAELVWTSYSRTCPPRASYSTYIVFFRGARSHDNIINRACGYSRTLSKVCTCRRFSVRYGRYDVYGPLLNYYENFSFSGLRFFYFDTVDSKFRRWAVGVMVPGHFPVVISPSPFPRKTVPRPIQIFVQYFSI